MDGHALRNQDQSERGISIMIHVVKRPIISVVYEAKGMTYCTQVPRTCVHKRLVFDFHLFDFKNWVFNIEKS